MAPAYEVRETMVQVERQGFAVDLFVVHETVGTFPGDLNWLIGSQQVSVNWYIRRDGKLYCLSQKGLATAHAGAGSWQGSGSQTRVVDGNKWGELNLRSEGVELEGPNNGTPFTAAQVATLRELVLWRCSELGIRPDRVVRHRDIAPDRKTDPKGLDWLSFTTSLWPDHLLVARAPSCTFEAFQKVLTSYNSPALAESKAIWDGLIRYGIDPAFAVSLFEHESSCGTKGKAVTTRNWGNIRRGMGRQIGSALGFAQYATWVDSALDWAQMLRERYADGWGLYTVERIIPTYAPSSDGNKPSSYVSAVVNRVRSLAGVPSSNALTAEIGGLTGTCRCDEDFRSFYDRYGGLLTFGYPLGDQFEQADTEGELCRYMKFENAWLKSKPSMPESWRLRPCSLLEVVHMSQQAKV